MPTGSWWGKAGAVSAELWVQTAGRAAPLATVFGNGTLTASSKVRLGSRDKSGANFHPEPSGHNYS